MSICCPHCGKHFNMSTNSISSMEADSVDESSSRWLNGPFDRKRVLHESDTSLLITDTENNWKLWLSKKFFKESRGRNRGTVTIGFNKDYIYKIFVDGLVDGKRVRHEEVEIDGAEAFRLFVNKKDLNL